MKDRELEEVNNTRGKLAILRIEKEDSGPTYSHDIFCPNCLKMTTLQIPRGELVYNYEANHECSRCGCTSEQYRNNMIRNGLISTRPT